jgi:hypothetical protein
LAAAYSQRVKAVVVDHGLVSFVAPTPVTWFGLPMGLIPPNLLEVADLAQIAALVAPRRLIIKGGVEVDGREADHGRLVNAYRFTRTVYERYGASHALSLGNDLDPAGLLRLEKAQ